MEDSLLFDSVTVGAGAVLRRCIVDKGVQVPPGESVGVDAEKDAARFTDRRSVVSKPTDDRRAPLPRGRRARDLASRAGAAVVIATPRLVVPAVIAAWRGGGYSRGADRAGPAPDLGCQRRAGPPRWHCELRRGTSTRAQPYAGRRRKPAPSTMPTARTSGQWSARKRSSNTRSPQR